MLGATGQDLVARGLCICGQDISGQHIVSAVDECTVMEPVSSVWLLHTGLANVDRASITGGSETGRLHCRVQFDSGAYPTTCPVGIGGSFCGGEGIGS